MTTNQKIWGKTLLSSYTYLNRLCDSLDELIKNTATNSYYTSSCRFNESSITTVSKKIIEYSNRKIDYINLKILIEKALCKINKKDAKLLVLKFFQKLPIESVSEILKISKRTSYRRLESAITAFMSSMTQMGYTPEKLEITYALDPFIKSILKCIQKNNFLIEEKAKVISNDSIFNTYVKELLVNLI